MRAWVIDRDGGPIGHTVTTAILGSLDTGSKQVLGWQQIDAAAAGSDDDVANAVVDERTWIAVVGMLFSIITFSQSDTPLVEQGASDRLVSARANGDATYNPAQAISVYYAQGRNEIAVGSYVLPITTALLGRIIAQFGAQTTAQYLSTVSGNQTAIGLLARAPQTISQPVFYTNYNLRPYSAQVATAGELLPTEDKRRHTEILFK